MTTRVRSSPLQSPTSTAPDILEEGNLELRLGTSVARCMQSIAEMHDSIVRQYEDPNTRKITLLNRGVWYPDEYIKYLRMAENEQCNNRYEWLRKKGHLAFGYLDSKFFDPVDNAAGNRRAWTFTIKPGILPTEALKAAINGLAILECGSTLQMTRYQALLDAIGPKKFNRLFQDILNISYEEGDIQPMNYFVDFTEVAKKNITKRNAGKIGRRPIKVGDGVNMKGVPLYYGKHPMGFGRNYNVICSQATVPQRFVGHGLPAKGATEEEIYTLMVDEYNKGCDQSARVTDGGRESYEFLAKPASLFSNDTRPVQRPEESVEGYDRYSPQAFNVALIQDLIQLPLEQVSMIWVKEHPAATKMGRQEEHVKMRELE